MPVQPHHGGIPAVQIRGIYRAESKHNLRLIREGSAEAVGLPPVKDEEEHRPVTALPDCRAGIQRIDPVGEGTGGGIHRLSVLYQERPVSGAFLDVILCQFLYMLKTEMKLPVIVDPGKSLSDARPAVVDDTATDDRMLGDAAVSGSALIGKPAAVDPGHGMELLHIFFYRIPFGK